MKKMMRFRSRYYPMFYKSKIMIILLLGLALLNQCVKESQPEPVKVAEYGYVGSFFQRDGASLEKALHPKLVKNRVTSDSTLQKVSAEKLIEVAKKRAVTDLDSVNLQAELLFMDSKAAAVQVTNDKFWDLVFLTNHDSTWLVTNVVWDKNNIENKGCLCSLKKTACHYVHAKYTGCTSTLSEILHPKVIMQKVISATESEQSCYKKILKLAQKNKCSNKACSINSFDIQVAILCTLHSYASVRVAHKYGTEYLHFKYINDKWLLINGIWDIQCSKKSCFCKETMTCSDSTCCPGGSCGSSKKQGYKIKCCSEANSCIKAKCHSK